MTPLIVAEEDLESLLVTKSWRASESDRTMVPGRCSTRHAHLDDEFVMAFRTSTAVSSWP